MNKRLQKWAEKKMKTLIKWSKEYDRLCKKEGITENNFISVALDRDYVSNMYSIQDTESDIHDKIYLFRTKTWFKKNENNKR